MWSMDRETDAAVIADSHERPVSFAAVFDRHFDAVHRYLARRVGTDVADDLAADAFLTAFRLRDRYDPSHEDARPWLFGIATNLVRHHRRSEVRRLRAYERIEIDRNPDLDEERLAGRADAAQAVGRIAGALRRIPDGERDALLLLAWADLTYGEIARALDLPIGTVRSRIHRARARLRELLGSSGQSFIAETINEVIVCDG